MQQKFCSYKINFKQNEEESFPILQFPNQLLFIFWNQDSTWNTVPTVFVLATVNAM